MSPHFRILVGFGVLFFSIDLVAQNSNELAPGYYVVVAAYARSQEKAAQQYVDKLVNEHQTATHGYNSTRKLYFVYLSYFNNLKESLREMKSVRDAGKFNNAWVRVVSGNIPVVENSTVPDSSLPPLPPRAHDASSVTIEKVEVVSNNEAASIQEPVTDNEEIVQYPTMTLGNTEVFLSLYNARNNRIVDGNVEVVDTDRSKLITKVEGNEYLNLPNPRSQSGQLTLICDVFGYRKIQQEINYPLPLADTVKDFIDLMGTTLVINFDLVRYHKGDLVTLFNVYFYNDASLMLPESKYELNTLLQLLQENPNYRIRIHGHTNGNYHGKIIAMGPEKNFFSLTGSVQRMGSAKDLSFDRAEIVKEYLIKEGVDADRMELKGWGGRRPIYDKNSANARKNVRVAVEILAE